jgi:tetratricopeptide (TPR) repeat protein
MKSNSFSKSFSLRATSLGLIATSIAGTAIVLAQALPPIAPSPVAPVPPANRAPLTVKPAPPATAAQPVAPATEVPVAKPPPPAPPATAIPGYNESGSAQRDSNRISRSETSFTPPAKSPSSGLTRNMLDEEFNSNPQAVAKTYEAMISSFDQQREPAAQSIFRLGEIYRRIGRVEEARTMYARILREFVDFPDLAKLAQRALTENAPTQPRDNPTLTATAPNPAEEELIRQELALVEAELAENEERIKAGMAAQSSGLPLKREILQLKQRLARTQTPGWITTMPGKDQPLEARASYRLDRPADSRGEFEQLQSETKVLMDKIALLSGKIQVEALSKEVINDPLFAELKGNYERALLNASDDENSKKALADAQSRLEKWIQEIYLPELKSTLAMKNARLEALGKRSEPLKR